MKKCLILLFVLIAACSWQVSKEIQRYSISERTDVFQEIPMEEVSLAGSAELMIKAQIKTHLKGFYLLESKDSLKGAEKYPFLFNIDGQAVVWDVDGKKENTLAGAGMRYVLEKRLRLRSGRHKVVMALPSESYLISIEVALSENASTLEFKPLYKVDKSFGPDFTRGLQRFNVFLNGKETS